MKTFIKYVPHGINEEMFYPITEDNKGETFKLQEFKKELFKGKDIEFVVFYNARNIRRKSTPDLILAYSLFCEKIGKELSKKCALLLHTHPIDENGTDLLSVKELLCDPEYVNVVFSSGVLSTEQLNMMYNISDVTCLISANEGWGLSLTESMMAGTMIIANTTGGMQDQMRFEDEDGQPIKFNKDFCSNHFGTYKKCGEWAVPVFPTNLSLVGSVPTPYIFDDRCDFRDVMEAIHKVYSMGKKERDRRGMKGRQWVTSDEAMMSSKWMCNNVISSIDHVLENWKPKKDYEFITFKPVPRKAIKHKLMY